MVECRARWRKARGRLPYGNNTESSCNSLNCLPLEVTTDLRMEIPAEFGPIVMGHSHLHESNRKGRKARGKAVTAITAEFDKLMDNEAKSSS
jgi:hypothetical protein